MTALERIKAAETRKFVDAFGDESEISLTPGVDKSRLQEIEGRLGAKLPEELREVLMYCGELEGLGMEIDFTGEKMMFGQEDVFQHGHPILGDGFGNFWVVDVTPENTSEAPVFFACHDAPVILFQSDSLSDFLGEVFKRGEEQASLLDAVSDDRLFKVWKKNPGLIKREEVIGSDDPVLSGFVESVPEHFHIVDLRKAQPGMGFSWGRYGPDTEIRRCGYDRIFAYGKAGK